MRSCLVKISSGSTFGQFEHGLQVADVAAHSQVASSRSAAASGSTAGVLPLDVGQHGEEEVVQTGAVRLD